MRRKRVGSPAREGTKLGTARGRREHVGQGFGESFLVVATNQQAMLSALKDRARPAAHRIRRDHGHATSHRLDEGKAECLIERRHHEEIRPSDLRKGIVDKSPKLDRA
jgi:hypothetical protein